MCTNEICFKLAVPSTRKYVRCILSLLYAKLVFIIIPIIINYGILLKIFSQKDSQNQIFHLKKVQRK